MNWSNPATWLMWRKKCLCMKRKSPLFLCKYTTIHCTIAIYCIDRCLLSSLLTEYVLSTDTNISLRFPEFCHHLLAGKQHLVVSKSFCSDKCSRHRKGMSDLPGLTADHQRCQWLSLNLDEVSIRETANCILGNFL